MSATRSRDQRSAHGSPPPAARPTRRIRPHRPGPLATRASAGVTETDPRSPAGDAAQGGRVLLANPDRTYRTAIATCLRAEGFAVTIIDLAVTEGLDALGRAEADAVLVAADVLTGPGGDAAHGLAEVRRLRPDLAIAVVASTQDDGVEDSLLAAGAADVFDRGRAPSIVAKRMRLLVGGARSAAPAGAGGDARLEVGPLTLRLESHRALWRGKEVPLTVTEFRIVRLLVTSGEAGASYRAIYDRVHGPGFSAGDGPDGFRTNVRSLIRRIRAKFRRCGAPSDVLRNLPGVGYCWSADSDPASRTGAAARRRADDIDEMGAVG